MQFFFGEAISGRRSLGVRGEAPLKKRPQSLKGSAVGGSIPSLATIFSVLPQRILPVITLTYRPVICSCRCDFT